MSRLISLAFKFLIIWSDLKHLRKGTLDGTADYGGVFFDSCPMPPHHLSDGIRFIRNWFPPVFLARSVMIEPPWRLGRGIVFRVSRHRGVIVGLWGPGRDVTEDEALLEAIGGRVDGRPIGEVLAGGEGR